MFTMIGNLDERVDERVVYEIMVQAGPLVDVYFPRDKDSKRHKGYGFAEYETEESAQYALRLFSGLVYLCNRSVRFAVGFGQPVLLFRESIGRLYSRCFILENCEVSGFNTGHDWLYNSTT